MAQPSAGARPLASRRCSRQTYVFAWAILLPDSLPKWLPFQRGESFFQPVPPVHGLPNEVRVSICEIVGDV